MTVPDRHGRSKQRSAAGPVAGSLARRRDGAAAFGWPQRGHHRRGHPQRQRRAGHAVSPLLQRQRPFGRGVHEPDPAGAHAAGEGSLRERLIAIVVAWAEVDRRGADDADGDGLAVAGAGHRACLPDRHERLGSREMRSLRERIAQQYSAPFDAIFDSPQAAAELKPVDRVNGFRAADRPAGVRQDQHAGRFRLPGVSRWPPSTGSSSASRRIPEITCSE